MALFETRQHETSEIANGFAHIISACHNAAATRAVEPEFKFWAQALGI